MSIKVTVWNEFLHEKRDKRVADIYPRGIHAAIADNLSETGEFIVRTATLEEPEHGLTEEVLDDTDVLIWWGHRAHKKVSDEVVERVHERVLRMGLIALHSAHHSKIFIKLMGTTCHLRWREAGEKSGFGLLNQPPIAEGLGSTSSWSTRDVRGKVCVPLLKRLCLWDGSKVEVFAAGATQGIVKYSISNPVMRGIRRSITLT